MAEKLSVFSTDLCYSSFRLDEISHNYDCYWFEWVIIVVTIIMTITLPNIFVIQCVISIVCVQILYSISLALLE